MQCRKQLRLLTFWIELLQEQTCLAPRGGNFCKTTRETSAPLSLTTSKTLSHLSLRMLSRKSKLWESKMHKTHYMVHGKLAYALAAMAHLSFMPQVVLDIDEKQLMSTVNEIKDSAKKLGDEVKRTAEDALKEAKNAGTLGAETKATADKLLTAHKETTDKLDKLIKQLE